MSNVATAKAGAEVLTASTIDPRHPPKDIIDGKEGTFWATTGLFPQEFILKLGSSVSITKIKTMTTNVKFLEVDKCEGMSPTSWVRVFSIKIADTEGRPQMEANQTPRLTATFLRFRLVEGWDDFATVHRIVVEGAAHK